LVGEPLQGPDIELTMTSENTKLPTQDDRIAARLRGFGPLGVIAVAVIVASQLLAPLSAVLVLIWAKRSRTPWSEIGYVRPQSWLGELVIGLILGIAFKFLMKAIVMPLLGADSVNQTYHYLVGNSYASLAVVPMMIVTGGFGEETFFRGYLFERFGKLIGHGPGAKALTVLITSVVFASLHYFDQGLPGAQQASITGLVFGTVFAFTRRLWPLMCAHASFDLTAVAIIYAGLESSAAHVVFK
jgi:membrane protease YdiL (CAAX protease family)